MENLSIGLILMVIGMGTVFIFLTIMIIVMNITTKVIGVINKYFPEPLPEEKNIRKTKQNDDNEIALVIAAAMRERGKVI